jgi:hypothetical protein
MASSFHREIRSQRLTRGSYLSWSAAVDWMERHETNLFFQRGCCAWYDPQSEESDKLQSPPDTSYAGELNRTAQIRVSSIAV